MKTYKTTVALRPYEMPAAIDSLTGDIRENIGHKKSDNIPKDKEIFEKKALFKKEYESSWSFLWEILTPVEYKVAHKLCRLAEMNTNSLKPLDDTTNKTQLAKEFGVHRNHIGRILKKLYLLGVYGRFEVAKPHLPHGKYWIVNPYLSFAGKLIHSDVSKLFSNTIVHMAFLELEHDYLIGKCLKMGVKIPKK